MNSKKRNNFILLGVLVFLIVSFFVYKSIFKSPDKVENIEIVFNGNTSEFLSLISTNSEEWNGKVIQLNGTISTIEQQGILLDNSTFCQFKDNTLLTKLQKDQTISVKGIVIGYDDLLNELKLNQCIIPNK